MDDGLKMWIAIGIITVLVLVLGPPALYYFALWIGIWLGVKAAGIIVTMIAIFGIIGGGIGIALLIVTTRNGL